MRVATSLLRITHDVSFTASGFASGIGRVRETDTSNFNQSSFALRSTKNNER